MNLHACLFNVAFAAGLQRSTGCNLHAARTWRQAAETPPEPLVFLYEGLIAVSPSGAGEGQALLATNAGEVMA
jgi:hypothetical protein